MDFTREPIIETIITPKDGCKLVVRSSKTTGQEEYFVDAVEIVSFGHSLFFRSLERPKAFLVPITDYEVLEVREARMVLKNIGLERSIKIAGGREGSIRGTRETEKAEVVTTEEPVEAEEPEGQPMEVVDTPIESARSEIKVDKKRDRRRHYRKRKGNRIEEIDKEIPSVEELQLPPLEPGDRVDIQPPVFNIEEESLNPSSSNLLSTLLQPPPQLISETIARYRENFKNAFFTPEEEKYPPHDKVQDLLNEEEETDFIPSTFEEPVIENTERSEEEHRLEEETKQEETFLQGKDLEEKATLPLFEEEEEPVLGKEEDEFQKSVEENSSP